MEDQAAAAATYPQVAENSQASPPSPTISDQVSQIVFYFSIYLTIGPVR